MGDILNLSPGFGCLFSAMHSSVPAQCSEKMSSSGRAATAEHYRLGASTTDTCFLTVLGGESPRSRWRQGRFLLSFFAWTADGTLLAVPAHGLSSVRVHPWCLFSFLIRTAVLLD